MDDGEVLALSQEMTISRDEFLRCLPLAVGGAACAIAGTEIRSRSEGRGWRISVVALPDLILGSFRLPRHRVEIRLEGYDAMAARAFLERFELCFRRAGG